MQGERIMPTVRELRISLGLNQSDLAVRAGVHVASINRMEQGHPVLRSTLILVAHALYVKPEEITGVTVINRGLRRSEGRKSKRQG